MSANKEQHMVAGFVAGLTSTALLHPFDLIKTRYQVFDGKGSAYNSVWNAVKEILVVEGTRGFYLGLTPAAIASTLSWGGYFYFYEGSKARKLDKMKASGGDSSALTLSSMDNLLAGIEAGSIMVGFTNPLWLIKTRLQLQKANDAPVTKYNGLSDAVVQIVRQEGILGLYKGSIPALILTSHGAVQFVVYEKCKLELESRNIITRNASGQLDISPQIAMIVGVVAKIAATTVTYPYQVIKSRLQQRDTVPVGVSSASKPAKSTQEIFYHTCQRYCSPSVNKILFGLRSLQSSEAILSRPKYNGILDCCMKIIKNESFLGFYKGFVANCLKVAPSASVTFAVYEYALYFLSKMK